MYEDRAKAAHDMMRGIVERYGPRLPGSEASLKAAAALEAAAALAGDQAGSETFTLHPGAFLGYIRVMVAFYAAAVIALPFLPWLSAGFLALGVAALVLEFFLYKEALDPFYKAALGKNVWASLEPTGPVKRQLVVSGHHDSAHIFNFFVDRPELYARRLYSGMGSYFGFLVLALGLAIAGSFTALPLAIGVAATALAALSFAFVAPLWRFAAKEGTPGAGDNLAASTVALEILRELRARRDAGTGLSSTRVVFASFDAEEAGLRGARDWAGRRTAEFAALPTYNYNMDCLYTAKDAFLMTTDINGSVRLDEPLAAACASLAKEAGVEARLSPIAFLAGGTDAAETQKAGARSTTLMAMPWTNDARCQAYHTPGDVPEAVGLDALTLGITVGVRLAERLDEGALD